MQQPEQIFCPECGAPIQFRGTAVSAVCDYCDSTVVRTGVDVNLIGKVSAIIDNGSPIILRGRGKFDGRPFIVDGRIQVQYDRGTWNEWFITFADGQPGWLVDAQGQYSIVTPLDPSSVAGRVPAFEEFQNGVEYAIAGRQVVAVDKRGASYKGAEGMLPYEAAPGMQFWAVDLRGYRGEFMTLDWGTNPRHNSPQPFAGRAIQLDEIGLFPLRRFNGWAPAKPPTAQ